MLFNTVQALYTQWKKLEVSFYSGSQVIRCTKPRRQSHYTFAAHWNVGNSRNIFVGSPDNESFKKNSWHSVTRRFLSSCQWRVNSNLAAGAHCPALMFLSFFEDRKKDAFEALERESKGWQQLYKMHNSK